MREFSKENLLAPFFSFHKMFLAICFVTVSMFLLTYVPACAELMSGQTIETSEYILFLPQELGMHFRRPLIVAFSPGADAAGMIDMWKAAAGRHQCLVLASKLVRNGIDVPPILDRLHRLIPQLAQKYPIDLRYVITTGVSGGGMTAHLMAFFYPDLVSAVISNIGMIHENSLKKAARYPKNKLAVFLTGPEDYNYQAMQDDRKFLESLGWKTHWLEFPGGHVAAPPKVIDEALTWVLQQLRASDPAAQNSNSESATQSSEP